MPVSTRHLPRNHPVRQMLEAAAAGRLPTKRELDQLADANEVLPDGARLERFRKDIVQLTSEAREFHRVGAMQQAREFAEQKWRDLAGRMTEDERALDNWDPNPESTSDIAKRMFPGTR